MCCCNWWAMTLRTVLFKYRVSYRHQTFMIETFKLSMKSCKSLICYLCMFNVQLHVHLKKWTLTFKLLYLRNYADYFNKIRRICCMNTHIKGLKVRLKSILPWLKYSIFSRDCFLLAHPVYYKDRTVWFSVCVISGRRDTQATIVQSTIDCSSIVLIITKPMMTHTV